MPSVPKTPQRRIQRYFSPLANRSRFSPELLIAPRQLVARSVFDINEDHSQGPNPQTQTFGGTNAQVISKPTGEVTRQSRGGYNLEAELGWDRQLYTSVQSHIHSLAGMYLNLNGTFSKQDNAKLQTVYDEAKKQFPRLENYQDNWVVQDFLRIYLKNASARSPKKSTNVSGDGQVTAATSTAPVPTTTSASGHD